MIKFNLKKHYLGTLCSKNHRYKNTRKSLRYISSRSCVECAHRYSEKRRREYREEVRQYNKKYRGAYKEETKRYNKKYRKKYPEKMKQYNEAIKDRNRSIYNQTKLLGCAYCGEAESCCLQFAHIDEKENDVCYLANQGISVLHLVKEIEKCELLCANCHIKFDRGLLTLEDFKIKRRASRK